ncbi:heat-inducible transcriptional repressor HrcA [Ligilactobacillus sp. LYQ112]|uniref:heat-inducible transcriptional repressor HrcA n=1 Tax=unclassified Ligilactobacillus TaxID=2767920 RepID=UPI003853F015
MLTERQLLILETIIKDYTDVGQPIGSKTLQEQLPVHVSSATIRNEMAALEKKGLIRKEHSSSGRVPSIKGYRYYVDNILTPAQVDQQALADIRSSFQGDFSKVDEIVATSANILSDLTNYTTITLKPEVEDVLLEGFRMVPLGSQQVMAILVASDGTVESKLFQLPAGVTGDQVEPVMRMINDQLVGVPLRQIPAKLTANLGLIAKYFKQPAGMVDVVSDILQKIAHEQYFVGGKMNVFNFANDGDLNEAKSLYTLMERAPELSDIVDPQDKDITVKIGDEMTNQLLLNYSVVSATYNVDDYGKGMIAILGPTNMPYSKVIGLLGALRQELTRKMLNYYHNFDE